MEVNEIIKMNGKLNLIWDKLNKIENWNLNFTWISK